MNQFTQQTNMKRPILFMLAASSIILSGIAMAAPCPYQFTLSGSNIDNQWGQVTNTAWSKMLSKNWKDNGFHFYSRIRARGPDAGINTPSDLESEIMKKVADKPEGTPNRREIILPIQNSSGQNLRVLYDYNGTKHSTCNLVTLTY